jgi:hypothetical protein
VPCRSLPSALLCGVAALAISACAGETAASVDRVTIADSAGITVIALSGDPGTLPLLRVADTLTLSGAPEDLFSNNPQTVIPLRDGRTILSDGQSFALFDAQGVHSGPFARQGQGPGEIGSLSGFWQSADDSIWVVDMSTRRLSRFSPTLEYTRSVMQPMWRSETGFSIWTGITGDTAAIVEFALNDMQRAPGRYASEMGFGTWVIGAENPVMTDRRPFGEYLVLAPGVLPETMISVPIGNGAQWRPLGRCVAYGYSDRWHFQLDAPGADGKLITQAVIRAPDDPVAPVTAELRERYITNTISQQRPSDFTTRYEKALREHVTFPDSTPHFTRVFGSRDGALWVQRYRGSATDVEDHWTIVDGSRGRAWRLVVPIGSRLLAVDSARVFIATRGEDDVESHHWWSLPELEGIAPPAGCRVN